MAYVISLGTLQFGSFLSPLWLGGAAELAAISTFSLKIKGIWPLVTVADHRRPWHRSPTSSVAGLLLKPPQCHIPDDHRHIKSLYQATGGRPASVAGPEVCFGYRHLHPL